ncbi:MAG: hypothetical protein ACYTEU_14220 [Planctomycetota bacterium]|jgi:hypothetical protein
MNKKQMTVILIALSILFVMSLFPVRIKSECDSRRGFAFEQRLKLSYGGVAFHSKIDLEETIGQMLPVIILGTGLVLALKDKRSA